MDRQSPLRTVAFSGVLTSVVFLAVVTASCASRETSPTARQSKAPPAVTTPKGALGAPADHTKDKDGVRHKPGYKNPEGICNPCHGKRLEGGPTAPSCTSCHEKEWD